MRIIAVGSIAASLLLVPDAARAATKVTWPEQRTYAAGEKIAIKVAASKRVRVAIVRTSAKGNVLRVVARKTLRRGTLRAALKKPGTYALRVTVNGNRRQRTISVAGNVASPKLPTTVDPLPCTGMQTESAELRLGATAVKPGGVLPYDIVNTGTACMGSGASYSIDRLRPDGTWENVPLPYVWPTILMIVAPGASDHTDAQIPGDLAPGGYRLRDEVFGRPGKIELSGRFEVVAG